MKKLLTPIAASAGYLALAVPAFAQQLNLSDEPWLGVNCVYETGGHQILSLGCIPALFLNIVNFAIAAAGVVALFMLIWGGYKIVFSGGDPKQLEGARGTITYAIVGLILVIMSYFILRFIAMTLGLDCITWFSLSQCVGP